MIDEDWLKKNIAISKLYRTAFIHRSYLNEVPQEKVSNERLEFLGDAVLSFVISALLYEKRPNDSEGELTNLRSFIVKTQSLAKAAQKLNLGKFLKMSKGEEMTGGRNNPQLLANTFEALLGAIYLDQGVSEVRSFIQLTLLPLFSDELKSGPPKDAKSLLQELTQSLTKQSPKYRILSTLGPDHAKEFTVGVFIKDKRIGLGKGLSKQIAEEKAASEALRNYPDND